VSVGVGVCEFDVLSGCVSVWMVYVCGSVWCVWV